MPGDHIVGWSPGTVLFEGGTTTVDEVELRLTGGPLEGATASVSTAVPGLSRDEYGRVAGAVFFAYRLQWWSSGSSAPVRYVRYVVEPGSAPAYRAHFDGYYWASPSTT